MVKQIVLSLLVLVVMQVGAGEAKTIKRNDTVAVQGWHYWKRFNDGAIVSGELTDIALMCDAGNAWRAVATSDTGCGNARARVITHFSVQIHAPLDSTNEKGSLCLVVDGSLMTDACVPVGEGVAAECDYRTLGTGPIFDTGDSCGIVVDIPIPAGSTWGIATYQTEGTDFTDMRSANFFIWGYYP